MAVLETEVKNKAIVLATIITAIGGIATTMLNYFMK